MRYQIVDVFAETALAGNPLAVVLDGAGLSDQQMQAIALETNLSETTFVVERSAERATVRIFTPTTELPFAGHPTLGTAWVLRDGAQRFTLDLGVGPVAVEFDADGVCWMAPPQPTVTGTLDVEQAAALIGLNPADLHTDYPISLINIGPQFVLIGVRDWATLERASMDGALRARLLDAGVPAWSAFVFCAGATAGAPAGVDYAARMFFDAQGVREDPATGSANSAFAVYLRDLAGQSPGSYVVAQGDSMGRPSRIHLDIGDANYRVGGKVQDVARGEFTL
ncbi:MAG: PhzF family phenazine biosynthesis protein [Pseudomonadota bacterium]